MDTRESENHSSQYYQLQIIRGVYVNKPIKKDIIEAICDYMPQDGDVIITSYPKTGTMWMTYIVQQIITRGSLLPTFTDMMTKIVPSLEMTGLSAINTITTKPRLYRHHLPYDKVQKNLNTKIIYVFRKPEDTFISRYHFIKNLDWNLHFDEFFEDFLSGKIEYGRYFEHIMSYLKHKDDGNILMVPYENLKINIKEEILRIANFLGDKHYEILSNDESVMHRIITHVDFDYMKQNLPCKIPWSDNDKMIYFRKGIVGDGKKVLTEQQLARLREVTKETMKGTEILEEWLKD